MNLRERDLHINFALVGPGKDTRSISNKTSHEKSDVELQIVPNHEELCARKIWFSVIQIEAFDLCFSFRNFILKKKRSDYVGTLKATILSDFVAKLAVKLRTAIYLGRHEVLNINFSRQTHASKHAVSTLAKLLINIYDNRGNFMNISISIISDTSLARLAILEFHRMATLAGETEICLDEKCLKCCG